MIRRPIIIIALLLFLTLAHVVSASTNAEGASNIFGVSVLQPSREDIRQISEAINKNGGDWGHVTLVIQENDRDQRKWQEIFDWLREDHLIPLVRIATSPEGENWRRPGKEDCAEWVVFLNKLNWVVRERYIILFNEPNHATEWGGEVDPKSYYDVVTTCAKAFKKANNNYKVMLAGLDGAAPTYATTYMDSFEFLQALIDRAGTADLLFKDIDALSSHSYPNPGFSGEVFDEGKKSIRGYASELTFLESTGLKKKLPVYITETGWSVGRVGEVQAAQRLAYAYEYVWRRDDRVVAVTPFVFSYPTEPFVGFSWKRPDNTLRSVYKYIQDVNKIAGKPKQEERGEMRGSIPEHLVEGSLYNLQIGLVNTGQSIWSKEAGHSLRARFIGREAFDALFPPLDTIAPGEEIMIPITVQTKELLGEVKYNLELVKGDLVVLSHKKKVIIEPLPSAHIKTTLFPKLRSSSSGVEVQIYDADERLIFKKKGAALSDGTLTVGGIRNIVPGLRYRIVLLIYPYLPIQNPITFSSQKTTVQMKAMYPLDFSGNGALEWADLLSLLKDPRLIQHIFP